MPIATDLEESFEELLASDLIAAIAGDQEARESVRNTLADVPADVSDDQPVADEFLILDADSSQAFAINAVLSGANLVVEGPPGTGREFQTIANLIACLCARKKTVLFVAEKRAAMTMRGAQTSEGTTARRHCP